MPGYRSLLLVLTVLVAALPPAPSGAGEAPRTKSEPAASSLLGTHWDFADASLDGWKHKDNATLSIVAENDNQAVRLQSNFAPYAFTWATRHFEPRSTEGVAHVTFRIRGDGSGHTLRLHLGATQPASRRPLYYVNDDQALVLDFQGWRRVSMDLDRFDTPGNGLRSRDLAAVIFLEFMITADDEAAARRPVDVRIDDIAMTSPTPEEVAEAKRRQERMQQVSAESRAAITRIKQDLAATRDKLDALERDGRYMAVARIYWTALDWCADDAMRLLESAEYDQVEQAPALLEDLAARAADAQGVLRHVAQQAPEEKDTLKAEENPYFQSVVRDARGSAKWEEFWIKGRKGYLSVPDAWSFRGFGDRSYGIVWSMTRPKSPLRHDPMLLRNALNLLDVIAHQHTKGDFNIDRTAVYGRDPNINRFCLAPALDAWRELEAAYPDLLPPAKRADLMGGFKQLVDYQVNDYGTPRLARKPEVTDPAYPNMDVHFILIMELAHRLWGDDLYARERDALAKILDGAVYPGGAWTYVNTQNECFVYHHLNVIYSARYWQLSGNPATLAMLRRTLPYYPRNVEPAGMPEYYTDPCWKHYWTGGAAPGPEVMAGLFDDPLNKRVANVCAAVWGYGKGHLSAIAAEFWKPIDDAPLPDNYVYYDENVQGPRGRWGTWSFAGNGRNYGPGYQGKDTFVGGMITDPPERPLPLDAALQVVTTEVRTSQTGNHWDGGLCHSAAEQLTTTTGSDFGSLAVRYRLSKPNWSQEDDLYPWQGDQQWYLSRNRLVGLVAMQCTADEKRAGVHGRIRLGMRRAIKTLDDRTWQYGHMVVKLHDHNYARTTTRPSETFYRDKPDKYRSTEITLLDPRSVAAGEKGTVTFPKGTRYYFLVEIRPDDSQPLDKVERIEQGPLVGFRFREAGRAVLLLHNPTDKPAELDMPIDAPAGAKLTVYRDHQGKGQALAGARLQTTLPPQQHLVAVAQAADQ